MEHLLSAVEEASAVVTMPAVGGMEETRQLRILKSPDLALASVVLSVGKLPLLRTICRRPRDK
jgi:hypothetical protein